MKDKGFISIQGWMINHLPIKGNELILFALIYGFSQDGETKFKGSISYIAKSLKCSRPTSISLAKKLVSKGLVVEHNINTINHYSSNTEFINNLIEASKETLLVKKLYHPSKETLPPTSKETLPPTSKETLPINNKSINNKNNYTFNNKEKTSFPNNSLFPEITPKNNHTGFCDEDIKDFKYLEEEERKKISAKKEIENAAVWVISRFNELCERNVSMSVSGRGSRNVQMVIKLLKKGYTKEDIELMIVHKSYQWKKDPVMCVHLEPDTLFGRQKSIGYIETAIEMKKNPELVQRFRNANQKNGGNVPRGSQLDNMKNQLLKDIPGMDRM